MLTGEWVDVYTENGQGTVKWWKEYPLDCELENFVHVHIKQVEGEIQIRDTVRYSIGYRIHHGRSCPIAVNVKRVPAGPEVE